LFFGCCENVPSVELNKNTEYGRLQCFP
jgi:hypothetical protein